MMIWKMLMMNKLDFLLEQKYLKFLMMLNTRDVLLVMIITESCTMFYMKMRILKFFIIMKHKIYQLILWKDIIRRWYGKEKQKWLWLILFWSLYLLPMTYRNRSYCYPETWWCWSVREAIPSEIIEICINTLNSNHITPEEQAHWYFTRRNLKLYLHGRNGSMGRKNK